jgi:D-xylose transport system substrate-binding protein
VVIEMIKLHKKQYIINNTVAEFVLFSLLIILLSNCTNTKGNSTNYSETDGKGCNKIGVLLPNSAYSGRWDSKDRPYLIKTIKKYLPNATVDYVNAEGDTKYYYW